MKKFDIIIGSIGFLGIATLLVMAWPKNRGANQVASPTDVQTKTEVVTKPPTPPDSATAQLPAKSLGKASVNQEPEAGSRCDSCNGTGQGTTECPSCYGNGSYTTPSGTNVVCNSCNGRGFKLGCPICKGTGKYRTAQQQLDDWKASRREGYR